MEDRNQLGRRDIKSCVRSRCSRYKVIPMNAPPPGRRRGRRAIPNEIRRHGFEALLDLAAGSPTST